MTNLDRIEELTLRLAESEVFFDLAVDLFCVVDIESGKFLRVNHAWERTTGWPVMELVGSEFIQYVHPDDLLVTGDEFAEIQREGVSHVNFKNRYRCRDGSFVTLSWRTSLPINGKVYSVARVVESSDAKMEQINRLKINRHIVRSCAESLAPAIEQMQLVHDRMLEVYEHMKAESE